MSEELIIGLTFIGGSVCGYWFKRLKGTLRRLLTRRKPPVGPLQDEGVFERYAAEKERLSGS